MEMMMLKSKMSSANHRGGGNKPDFQVSLSINRRISAGGETNRSPFGKSQSIRVGRSAVGSPVSASNKRLKKHHEKTSAQRHHLQASAEAGQSAL